MQQQTPPLSLIRWWFSKTDEERQAFLENTTTSVKAKQNIRIVDNFSRYHSYFVACETNLEVCPLPPLSPAPRLPLRNWGYSVRLPCVMHGETTFSGRYLPSTRRVSRRDAARRLLDAVCLRTAVALRDYTTTCPQPGDATACREDDWCARASQVVVDALVEASVVALCRLGLLDALETIEKEAADAPLLNTALPGGKKADAAPKPVGAHRAEGYGCVGVWALLNARSSAEAGAPSYAQCAPKRACTEKRTRDRNAGGGRWKVLRERFSSPRGSSLSFEEDEDEDVFVVPHTAPQVVITAADMRFGIARALGKLGKEAFPPEKQLHTMSPHTHTS